MNPEQSAASFEPEDVPAQNIGAKQEAAASLVDAGSAEADCSLPVAVKKQDAVADQEVAAVGAFMPSIDHEQGMGEGVVDVGQKTAAVPVNAGSSILIASEKHKTGEKSERQVNDDESTSSLDEPTARVGGLVLPFTAKPVSASKRYSFFQEQTLPAIEMPPEPIRRRTRREVIAFGIGAATIATGAAYLLPNETLKRLGMRRDLSSRGKEWLLNSALRIDDDVAEALYSHNRMVPTYTRSQITPIKNNYNGATPDAGYVAGWKLTLEGLASGLSMSLDIRTLMNRFSIHDQITRFVCVEGWSAIAWWSGLRFADLLQGYPPKSQARWVRVESSVNLDNSGNPDPYFVSIDLATARHSQTLLATHHDGQPLTVEHGAPLRLLVPVKLGLKNVKAITRITYSVEEPRDYWTPYGYSSYDGI